MLHHVGTHAGHGWFHLCTYCNRFSVRVSEDILVCVGSVHPCQRCDCLVGLDCVLTAAEARFLQEHPLITQMHHHLH